MLSQDIISLLQCVECQGGALFSRNGSALVCRNCSHAYSINNGIPDLRPQKPLRQPKIYDDPEYKKWRQMLAASQDYFYKSGGAVTYVQNSGHRMVRNLIRNNHYEHILDLGCGDGAHYPFLTHPQQSFGIDIDQASLEKLTRKYPAYRVLCADGYQLPLKDQSIDCIVNIYNLEHMISLDIALEEMLRVLAPGGKVYISVPHIGGGLWETGSRLTSRRHFRAIDHPRVVAIEHVNCIWQLEKAIKRHFKINRKVHFPFRIPSFYWNLITTYQCEKLRP